jgi:hypothetical protein
LLVRRLFWKTFFFEKEILRTTPSPPSNAELDGESPLVNAVATHGL